jgi:hypothetical protein
MDIAARTAIAPALGVEAPRPQSLGRWVGHMRYGRFTHQDIADAPVIPHEAEIGIMAHYAIGLTLGALYALLLRVSKTRHGSPSLALAYGTGTTAFSWFLMFPAAGKGALGRRETPKLGTLSLCNHIAYGLALGMALSKLTPAARGGGTRPT